MNIARASIDRPIYTWLIILIALFGGIWGFLSLGRLEDPAFTIKNAVIATQYPARPPSRWRLRSRKPLESAIQQMGEVDTITSVNQPGLSLIEVEIKSTYDGTETAGNLDQTAGQSARHCTRAAIGCPATAGQ